MSCVWRWFCVPVSFLLLEAGEERHGKEECEAEEEEEGEEEKELSGNLSSRDVIFRICERRFAELSLKTGATRAVVTAKRVHTFP